MVRRSASKRAERSGGNGARHCGCRRAAIGPDGAAQGPRPDGFVFYTNQQSAKGEQLAANPRGGPALPLEVACAGRCASKGTVERVGDDAGRCLFRQPQHAIPSLAPGRRISRAPLDSRATFEQRFEEIARQVRWTRRSAPAALGRLSRDTRADRVLDAIGRTACTNAGCSFVSGDGWSEGLLYP